MKKTLSVVIVLAVLLGVLFLASCDDGEHVHDFAVNVVEPTCISEGYTEYTCECGEYYRDTFVAKDSEAHKFGEYQTVKDATCTEKGSKEHTCEYCGKVEADDIKMLEHKYGELIVDTAATCHSTGTGHKVCSVCEGIKEETIKMDDHSFTDWAIVGTEHVCGEYNTVEHHCTNLGCGYKEEKTVSSHKLTEVEVVKPTCTTAGYTLYRCDVCEEEFKGDFVKPTGKHTYGDTYTTEEGYKAHDCTNCGHTEIVK